MITAKAISGLGGKGPACFLVEAGRARFLLDLGEGPAQGQFPDLAGLDRVDAVLVSHGHADHIGGLHLAAGLGNPPLYASAMTRAFMGHAALEGALDLPLNGRIEICGVKVETGRAGHAAGAVWMRIGGEEGVLYTGDFCRESLLYPADEPLPARLMIADASYGEYDADLAPAMAGLLEQARRGPLLLPLPPTGRGVEIAVLLHEAGLPLSICPQHRHVAGLMLASEAEVLVPGGRERIGAMLAAAGALTAESDPHGAMIAANGGATGGLSKQLLERFAPEEDVAIILTGHVEEATMAGAALRAGRAAFLRWNVHPRRRDLAWLHEKVQPQSTLYAFCPAQAADILQRTLP